jgi:hypothetical protein
MHYYHHHHRHHHASVTTIRALFIAIGQPQPIKNKEAKREGRLEVHVSAHRRVVLVALRQRVYLLS